MEALKTAQGQLAIASEFRFVYWTGSSDYAYYVVKRGRRYLENRWGVLDSSEYGVAWNGTEWGAWRGADMFCYVDLEEALVTARTLAFEENQRIIDDVEREFPGQFRGGQHDLAGKEERRGIPDE